VGVAAHEAGHAVQYARNYAPIKLRMAVIPLTKFGSTLAVPLIFIGFLIEAYNALGDPGIGIMLVYAGIICYSAVAFFQLVTLPVELNASNRAVASLNETGILSQTELPRARKVLNAAALTYVAALITTLAQILRFLMMANRRRR